MLITRESLHCLAPRPSSAAKAAIWDGYADALAACEGDLAAAGILHARLRFVHFIATCAHETGGFCILWESGAYSAERIGVIFGPGRHSAAIGPAEAARIAGNSYALFERVYGLGNPKKARELGNREPGDGYKYRGLGIGQTTGREAHEKYAAMVPCSVEELCHYENNIKAACSEWASGRCNERADADDVTGVRKIWNGGQNGIADVRQYLAEAKQIWPDRLVPVPVVKDMLELGDRGEAVKFLQEELARAGFPCGVADGKFGALTERQVAAFQVAHGLIGTGQADASVMKLLVDDDEDQYPPEAVPGRQNLDAQTLVDRGNETVKAGTNLNLMGRVLNWLGLTATADSLLGTGGVEAVLTGAEKLTTVATRSSKLADTLLSQRVLIIVIMLGAGFLLSRYGSRIVGWAVNAARSGADTSPARASDATPAKGS